MLYSPFSLSAFRNNVKLKRSSIRESIFIMSIDSDAVCCGADSLAVIGQGGAVVIRLLHLDGYGPSGCLGWIICDTETKQI